MVDSEGVRFLLTTGDNVYARARVFGVAVGGTGDEDDDWFFTFFQPYRYVINRIPVYPSIGNHDADETEERDDRAQVEDNFYIHERIKSEEAAGRASFGPGLFYRFRYGSDIEFVCIDTSKEAFFRSARLFEFPKHWEFIEQSFPSEGPHPAWRIPFAHHPVYSAGPQHHNTRSMQKLLPLFERSNVRVMFTGHEHNFQHSRTPGFDHFVTGAAGKVRRSRPDRYREAHTVSWATDCHFLLARIEGRRMQVRAIAAMDDPAGRPVDIERFDPDGEPVSGAIEIEV
jgi:hypothetical protein